MRQNWEGGLRGDSFFPPVVSFLLQVFQFTFAITSPILVEFSGFFTISEKVNIPPIIRMKSAPAFSACSSTPRSSSPVATIEPVYPP